MIKDHLTSGDLIILTSQNFHSLIIFRNKTEYNGVRFDTDTIICMYLGTSTKGSHNKCVYDVICGDVRGYIYNFTCTATKIC